jgi:hypothetical protein
MIRTLLGAASAAAILTGGASAQAQMSVEEAKALLSGYELTGYRIESDDCGASCDALGEGGDIRAALNARAASDGEGGTANAPRIDLSAEGVRFRGRGPVLFRDRTREQVVFLNFGQVGRSPGFSVDVRDGETEELIDTIEFQDYPFTQEDRIFIRDRIAADYAEFDIEVTLERPSTDDFALLDFTDNDRDPGDNNITLFLNPDGTAGFSILFGRAEGIDFGNDDLGTGSFADANFWQVLADIFTPASFERLTGLPANVDEEGNIDPASIRLATITQAANTGAHEVGHTIGLRHHDAFGAPGAGLPSTGRPAPGTFVPVYDGPQEATETTLHIMASGASSGLSLAQSANSDRFLSERSSLKTRLAEEARVYDEGKLWTDRRTHVKSLRLFNGLFPNTIEEGVNEDQPFLPIDYAWVQGSLVPLSTDEYKFFGKAGEFITAEVISFTDSFIAQPILSELQIFKVERNGSRTLLSTNNQTFEPFDPLLLDVELPETGEYVLQVSTPDIIYLDLNGDGIAADSLIASGFGFFLEGDYDLLVYSVEEPLGRGFPRQRRNTRILGAR